MPTKATPRTAEIKRTTKETDIAVKINLDGGGNGTVATGIGFLDHMLDLFRVHGGFDVEISCKGDINVDYHHSVEDVAIVLGQCVKTALGDKKGIKRYASALIPMDEALAEVTLDVSGRPFLVFNAELKGKTGDFDLDLIEEFMRALSYNAGLTAHINLRYGSNGHHIAEAIFKALARALADAVRIVGDKIPSSKGILE
ncbi:MAG: imidazoleglycerol-phosphate dehydratase HisB [Clostridiales bacterium]|jgi:imidazoleglycerol-phosphate dehydratase|nr:imidazoleglycerol-phosphate dehydratase HisB [Clostridiales bacterium]